jgi:hypothetical protein
MSEEKEKEALQKILQRIDELLMVLNQVTDDLRQISIALKSVAVSHFPQPLTSAPPTPGPLLPKVSEKVQAVEDIKTMFPEDLENLLDFEEKEDYVIVRPRQFLGSENFAKIASAVRGMGGEYISAGKASHFRVPKKRP